MTSVLEPTAAEAPPPTTGSSSPRSWRSVAVASVVVLPFAVWTVPVTHGTGGRDPWVLGLGLLSLLPALLVLRPWQVVPTWQAMVAISPALAALLVCLTAPTGWDGLDELATFVYGGAAYLVVRAWASTPMRRRVALLAVALVGLEQFTQAYLPWWGGSSVRNMMVGTFYWHNQFSIFMAATGLVAGVLAVRGEGPFRLAGRLVAPWCFAALLFAGSRAGLATFVLVWSIFAVLSFMDRRGRVAVLALVAVALGLATLLASPLLMEDSGWIGSTLKARQADQSVEGNGRARLVFWKAAVDLGLDHPVTGAGFDSFGSAGSARMPFGSGLSIFVHNGYLQAFSDGGFVLLLTVIAATGLPLLMGLRLVRLRRNRCGQDDLVACAVPLALLALVLHAGVDFDWAYPSLVTLFALLAGLLPHPPRSALRRAGVRRSAVGVGLLVILLVLGAVPAALRASSLRAPGRDRPLWVPVVALGLPLAGSLDWLPAASVCRSELDGTSRAVAVHGLACSSTAAAEDPGLQLLRAKAMVRLGHRASGLRLARSVIAQYGERRPLLRLTEAEVFAAAGRPAEARAALLAARNRVVRAGLLSYLPQIDAALAGLDGATD